MAARSGILGLGMSRGDLLPPMRLSSAWSAEFHPLSVAKCWKPCSRGAPSTYSDGGAGLTKLRLDALSLMKEKDDAASLGPEVAEARSEAEDLERSKSALAPAPRTSNGPVG